MSTALTTLVVLAAALFLMSLHVRLWRRRYHLALGADATYYAETADGWRLALHRYRPIELAGREPVVLCHGMGANAYNMDLGQGFSLARFLRDRGFDVWSAELRGAGMSRIRQRSHKDRRSICFDDHVEGDVPTIIQRVLGETGARRLHWVGHSMGGLVMYAHLAHRSDPRVTSLTTLGSPATFEGTGWLRRFAPLLRVASWLPTVDTRFLTGLVLPLYWSLPCPVITHFGPNIPHRVARRAIANLVEPVTRGTLAQAARWLRSGQLTSRDGSFDVFRELGRIATPALLIGGSVDQIARPIDVRRTFECLGSAVKTLHMAGQGKGAPVYGHGDLAVGRAAERDIFPHVARWLAGRPWEAVEDQEPAQPATPLPEPEPEPEPEPPVRYHLTRPTNPYDPYARRRRSPSRTKARHAVESGNPSTAEGGGSP